MSALAILLEACIMTQIREPSEFYGLSGHAQGLWLAHARNKVSGAYHRKEQTPDERKEALKKRAFEAVTKRGLLREED